MCNINIWLPGNYTEVYFLPVTWSKRTSAISIHTPALALIRYYSSCQMRWKIISAPFHRSWKWCMRPGSVHVWWDSFQLFQEVKVQWRIRQVLKILWMLHQAVLVQLVWMLTMMTYPHTIHVHHRRRLFSFQCRRLLISMSECQNYHSNTQ